jgi:predicted ATPase with chaperone activity
MELNFIFVGNPGTGKTTVARRMGLLFHSLGVLADGNHIVSCTASDFVTGYVNQVCPMEKPSAC